MTHFLGKAGLPVAASAVLGLQGVTQGQAAAQHYHSEVVGCPVHGTMPLVFEPGVHARRAAPGKL